MWNVWMIHIKYQYFQKKNVKVPSAAIVIGTLKSILLLFRQDMVNEGLQNGCEEGEIVNR